MWCRKVGRILPWFCVHVISAVSFLYMYIYEINYHSMHNYYTFTILYYTYFYHTIIIQSFNRCYSLYIYIIFFSHFNQNYTYILVKYWCFTRAYYLKIWIFTYFSRHFVKVTWYTLFSDFNWCKQIVQFILFYRIFVDESQCIRIIQ